MRTWCTGESLNAFKPTSNPENAAKRRKTVLYLMRRHGYITEEEEKMANEIPVESLTAESKTENANPYQGYIDTVVDELKETYGVNTSHTLRQRNIIIFRHQEFCIISTIHEICHDSLCYFTIVESFTKLSIWTPFSCGHHTMTIVDKDFHSYCCLGFIRFIYVSYLHTAI